MNAKSAVIIEVRKNDNVYEFVMPAGAPLGEAYDAGFEVLKSIVELSHQAVERAKQPSNEEVAAGD